jgi:hypothetical protein
MSKNNDLNSKAGLEDFFSDLGDESIEEGYDEIDQLVDEVLAFLENYAGISGGIVTFNTLKRFLLESNHSKVTEDDVFEIVGRLRNNNIFSDEVVYEDVPDFYMYTFNEIQLDEEERIFLKPFIKQNRWKKTALPENPTWDIAKFGVILGNLIQKRVIKSDNDEYWVPGLQN